MFRAIAFALLIAFGVGCARAAGPDAVAAFGPSWPDPLEGPQAFDRASRAQILSFAAALAAVSEPDAKGLKANFRAVQADSVARTRDRLADLLTRNFELASKSCGNGEPFCPSVLSPAELFKAANSLHSDLPPRYAAWLGQIDGFNRAYAGELIRLAPYFPYLRSDAPPLDGAEHDGAELPDRRFLLTLDDGPTDPGGTTDETIRMLDREGLHALFFVVGERLAARTEVEDPKALRRLYESQCVALHGWKHVSHRNWPGWRESILRELNLARQTFPDGYRLYFRPPYYLLPTDSGAFFADNDITVAMWNIDSQDWRREVSVEDASRRALTLMLLWRRGVLLFHDTLPKAQAVIPWLVEETRSAGIVWDDCHSVRAEGF